MTGISLLDCSGSANSQIDWTRGRHKFEFSPVNARIRPHRPYDPLILTDMTVNKRQLLLRGLKSTGGLRLLESVRPWTGLVVLNYHRIGTAGDSLFDRALWSATQDDFDQQVRQLKRNCEIIGLEDLTEVLYGLECGRPSFRARNRFAMITFDDGYRDNFEYAFPVLKSNGVPAVFFITTGFLDRGSPGWWDEISWMVRSSTRTAIDMSAWLGDITSIDPGREAAIQKLVQCYYGLDTEGSGRFLECLAAETGTGRAPAEIAAELWMNWDQVREMRDGGMSFGAHTVTHPVLATRTAEEQSFEICESKLRLEQELGDPVTALSYPVGRRDSFDQTTRTALSHHGIELAFSYYGGHVAAGQREPIDRHDIPRVAVESDTSLSDFRSYLALPQIFARH